MACGPLTLKNLQGSWGHGPVGEYGSWANGRLLPSVTNGVVLELQYGLGRQAPAPMLGASGVFDMLALGGGNGSSSSGGGATSTSTTGGGGGGGRGGGGPPTASVRGWTVDAALPGRGRPPVAVQVSVDSQPVAAALALDARPDLVPAGVAPNAQHGFTVELPAAAAAALAAKGRHTVDVHMVGSPSSEQPWPLQGSPKCVCDGRLCAC